MKRLNIENTAGAILQVWFSDMTCPQDTCRPPWFKGAYTRRQRRPKLQAFSHGGFPMIEKFAFKLQP